jgi:hypothetical protein
MANNTQLPPPGGSAGYSAAHVQPGPRPGRALLIAALLLAGGAMLGLLGGLIWAAAAPRVVYQVATLTPPTAYATNAETSAFIAADGIYTFIALGGGALLGLAGYLFGVRKYGPAPMVGIVAGGVAAAFLAKWLGTLLTGGQTFDSKLASSKPGAILRAPITVGAHGALAFWPVAAAVTAGILELSSVMRARRLATAAVSARLSSGGARWREFRGMPGVQPFPPGGQPYQAGGPPYQADGQPYPAAGQGGQPLSADGQSGQRSASTGPVGQPAFPPPPPPAVGPASSRQPWPADPSGQPPPGRFGLPDADQHGPDTPVG